MQRRHGGLNPGVGIGKGTGTDVDSMRKLLGLGHGHRGDGGNGAVAEGVKAGVEGEQQLLAAVVDSAHVGKGALSKVGYGCDVETSKGDRARIFVSLAILCGRGRGAGDAGSILDQLGVDGRERSDGGGTAGTCLGVVADSLGDGAAAKLAGQLAKAVHDLDVPRVRDSGDGSSMHLSNLLLGLRGW